MPKQLKYFSNWGTKNFAARAAFSYFSKKKCDPLNYVF